MLQQTEPNGISSADQPYLCIVPFCLAERIPQGQVAGNSEPIRTMWVCLWSRAPHREALLAGGADVGEALRSG